LEEVVVEGTDAENFGVLIVKDNAVCKREFGLWEAFHAGSEGGIRNVVEESNRGAGEFGNWSRSALLMIREK
jgi:hypothetical protein